MSLEKELTSIREGLNGYKTVQSTYSDSAKLYKATFNPGLSTGTGFIRYKITCITSIPLENAIFQISPQCGPSIGFLDTDINPLYDDANVFYWYKSQMTSELQQTDARYFGASAFTIFSNVPFELQATML